MEATADSKSQPADALQPWISLEYHLHQQSWEIDQKKQLQTIFCWWCFFLIAWSFEKKQHVFLRCLLLRSSFAQGTRKLKGWVFWRRFYRLMLFRKWKQILEQVEQSCRHSKMRTTTKKCWIQDQVVIGDLVILFLGFHQRVHSIWSQSLGKGHLDNLEDGKAAGDDHHCDFWLILFSLKETVRSTGGGW